MADKKPEKVEKPSEPTITITEVKSPGVAEAPITTEDFVPSAEDLARLAKNFSSTAPEPNLAAPLPEVPERTVVIPASIAKRTLEEMERGRQITDAKIKWRDKMLGDNGG